MTAADSCDLAVILVGVHIITRSIVTHISCRYASGPYVYEDGLLADAENPTCTNSSDCIRPPLDMPLSRQSWIDKDYTDESVTPKVRVACAARVRIGDTHAADRVSCWQVRNGVKMGEGDGTVSLLSLGAMCVEGWKRERWNPGGVRVVTVEVRTLRASSLIFWT